MAISSRALKSSHPFRLGSCENVIEKLRDGHKGDTLALDFLPSTGTQLRLNGAPQGAAISGNDFYRALLMIWLGDKPVQDSLKRQLLTNNR